MGKRILEKHYHRWITLMTMIADSAIMGCSFTSPFLLYAERNLDFSLFVSRAVRATEFLQESSPVFVVIAYLGPLTSIAVTLQVVIFWLVGLYRREISYLNFEELRRVIKATFISYFIISLGVAALGFNAEDYRRTILISLMLTLAGVVIERYVFYEIAKANYRKGRWVKKIAIYDACPLGRMLLKKLFEAPQLGYKPVGFLDNKIAKGEMVSTNSLETVAQIPVLGRLGDLHRVVPKHEIQELFVATAAINMGDMRKIASACRRARIPYRFVPNLMEEPFHRAVMYSFGGIPFIKTEEPRVDAATRFAKRLFDIVFSLFVLVLSAPFLAAIAYLIKKDSRGPVFFTQTRIGKDGVPFKMYKFRTMKMNAPKYAYSPVIREDKRITGIGRFLRRSSLDELPQFLNVLKGDMSVVGPRPEMPFIVEKYNATQRERLLVKPGITGIWQVTADRKKLIHENLDYDLYYIDNVSILLDLVIMARTVWFVTRGIGAV